MQYIVPFIVPIISFFLQSYPRFFNRYFGVDVWTRLIEIDQVRREHHKIPGKISKGFIIDGYFDYPIVFPWLLSFIPKKVLFEIQGFISPIFDCLQNVLVYFVAYYLFGNIQIALIAQLIYMLTPITILENSYLTPRSFGYFLFTLSFLPLIFYTIDHQWTFLLFAYFVTTLLFLTHRFALQSLLFISIFFTFFDRSLIFLLNFAVAFVSATLLTKGYYLRIAKGHFYNIYFWVKNYQYRFAHQVFGNKKQKKQDWVGAIYKLLSTFSPILIFGTSLWTISAFIYLILFYIKQVTFSNILFQMSIWVVFFYVLAIIVLKVKRLIPIGEGQRYLEMATVPSAILSAYIFLHFSSFYYWQSIFILGFLLLANFFLIIFIQIKGIIQDKNRSLTENMLKVFAYINGLKGTPRIMCIPHQITTMTIYNTKADVLVNADNKQLMTMFDFYPVLTKPLPYIAKKYKLDYLLMRESFVTLAELKINQKDVIFTAGDVKIVRI